MDASDENLFALSFNQDFTCFSIGTKREGYKLYSVDNFGKIHAVPQGGYGIVEMLFCTSLVALVGLGESQQLSPRRLQIVNTKRHSTICELTFPTAVLAIKLNRKRLIAFLEHQIYVYDIANMKLLHTIETSPNPYAVCALSASSDNCFLAYPAPPEATESSQNQPPSSAQTVALSGNVIIYDVLTLEPVNTIEAHRSSLSALSISPDGTRIATASDKGTVIRIFGLPNGEKLFQFRRGSLPVKIHCINFNAASTFLVVTSASETIHIFKLSHDQQKQPSDKKSSGHAKAPSRGTMGMIRKSSQTLGKSFAGAFGSYLPNSVTEIWEPMRDFASLKIPTSCTKSIAALHNTSPQVMVVTSTGHFLQYEIDYETGGDCQLIGSFELLENAT